MRMTTKATSENDNNYPRSRKRTRNLDERCRRWLRDGGREI